MKEIIPPFCLVLTVLLLIGGFATLAVEAPQPSIELHRARLGDDDQYRDLLEQRLEHQRLQRKVLVGSLFGLAVVMGALGYLAMRPAGGR